MITFREPVPDVYFAIHNKLCLEWAMLTLLKYIILWMAVYIDQVILQRRPLLFPFFWAWNGWGNGPIQMVGYWAQPFCYLAEWRQFACFREFLFQSCNENTNDSELAHICTWYGFC